MLCPILHSGVGVFFFYLKCAVIHLLSTENKSRRSVVEPKRDSFGERWNFLFRTSEISCCILLLLFLSPGPVQSNYVLLHISLYIVLTPADILDGQAFL